MSQIAVLCASLFLFPPAAQDSDPERIGKKIQDQIEKGIEAVRKFGEDAQRWLKDFAKSLREKLGLERKSPKGGG